MTDAFNLITFDAPVYNDPGSVCPSVSCSNAGCLSATLLPCCALNVCLDPALAANATGCFCPTDVNATCIDSSKNITAFLSASPLDDQALFEAGLASPCSNILIRLNSLSGEQTLLVSPGGYYDPALYYRSPLQDSIALCCSASSSNSMFFVRPSLRATTSLTWLLGRLVCLLDYDPCRWRSARAILANS